MITQTLRLMLLVGLLIFPPATATVALGLLGGAGLGHHGPVMCGPGPDC
jgi:hypothetical protein